ncbi:HU family DNA-binding protein [Hydrogenophilus thermoluteolus]|jgi:DNA-binding protein HU-beta|uniref:DNA-binding protein HU n=1 Tax=Hydrogenophilus thermoluteolus TaxID=297 RepID=A0A2Z6E0L0_HYDTE|nr:HU family DNA-binding protein [Hydrogenophilus thermoluteolus]HCO78173.1 DNA-binding protein HU [Rhodocyclaceae bacterium]MBW7656919.1 HU family DNA-binding protein [Hydrogenophilus thermoluteolus]BBD78317.1 DNA-binding protein HU [Hydrogenophilus thermoluteolus]GLW60476.1 transcriptional regulator [Hydrogenophilus thermoluteolus]HNQ47889.1 HU family DNA-binding protein [Hydrogenophilus thermoluteolus]
MNKSEFVEALADKMGSSKAEAARALDAVLATVTEQLAKGEKITFTGFGSFEVVTRGERTGRNPQTGATITIPATKLPKFTAGAALKKAVLG